MNRHTLRTTPRPRFPIVAALLAAVVTFTSGCKKDSQSASDTGAGDGHAHEGEHAHEHEGEAHENEIVLAPDAIDRYGVTIQPAQLWQLQPTFVAPARVVLNGDATAHVGAALAGRAVEIIARAGDLVEAGDALFIVESPELGDAQNSYLVAISEAQAAAAPVELAKAAWERAKGLYETSEGIALAEVQRREGEYKAALVVHRAAELAVLAAQTRLSVLGMAQDELESIAATGKAIPRLTVRAPIAGSVVRRELTLGELVGPDRGMLFLLSDVTKPWVVAEVPEARLLSVARGAQAWVLVGLGGARHQGKVTFVSTLVDTSTRTAQARVELDQPSADLKPGMFTQAEITLTDPAHGESIPVIAVSEEAVHTIGGAVALFVPVPNEANTFAARNITIGRAVGGLVPVYAGLVEGESYVATGAFILKAELGKSGASHGH